MSDLEGVIKEGAEYISKKIATEIAKYYGIDIYSSKLKSHKPYKMPKEIKGATNITCNPKGCCALEKYVNEEIIEGLDWYDIIRTEIHEHMHEILAYKFPGITRMSYIDPTIHEMLAEYLPYKWLKERNPKLAEKWKSESPYYDLIRVAERIDKERSITEWAEELDKLYRNVEVVAYKNWS